MLSFSISECFLSFWFVVCLVACEHQPFVCVAYFNVKVYTHSCQKWDVGFLCSYAAMLVLVVDSPG